MRLIVSLAVLLFAAPAFAFNDATVRYCATTPQPQHCVSSFLTFEQYYAAEYLQFLAEVEKDPLNTTLPPAKADDLARVFCDPPRLTGTTAHCRDTLTSVMPYTVGFMSWYDQLARQREHGNSQQEQFAQQRQIDAQLEQARIQANGKALFGSGNAMINGMNQGFQNMQQPYVNTPYSSYPPAKK